MRKKKFEKVQKYKYKFTKKEYPSVSHTADSSPLFGKSQKKGAFGGSNFDDCLQTFP